MDVSARPEHCLRHPLGQVLASPARVTVEYGILGPPVHATSAEPFSHLRNRSPHGSTAL